MKRLLAGVLIGLMMNPVALEAIRIPKPPTLTQWDQGSLAQLNASLESLWQLTNGRYTTEVITTNPNGSRVGTNGDAVYYNNAGAYKLCVNTTATTASSPTGTTWRCSANAFTAP